MKGTRIPDNCPVTASEPSACVAVVVLNWNGWRDTLPCLQSLLQSDYPAYRIIVCDNGSTDGSLHEIEEWLSARAEAGPTIMLHSTGANLGFAGGNNEGIRIALDDPKVEMVWLLNNDTLIHPAALRRQVEAMNALPAAGLCGSTLLDYEEPYRVRAIVGRYRARWGLVEHVLPNDDGGMVSALPARVLDAGEFPIGASLLASRAMLECVGLLREDHFLYFEELDLVHRMRPKFQSIVAPSSLIRHREAASTRAAVGGGRPLADYCFARARMQFTRRFYPQYRWSVLASGVLSVARRVLIGRFRNAAAVWAGVCDGWAGRMGAGPAERWIGGG